MMKEKQNSEKVSTNSSEENLELFINEAIANGSKILVSACLLGENIKYNGGNNAHHHLIKLFKKNPGLFIPVCPENDGGLPTPRPPAEIQNKKRTETQKEAEEAENTVLILNNLGEDVSEYFLKGAAKTLETAQKYGANYAILKESSPSCGANLIYDGNFNGTKIPGAGVTTQLLRKNGIKVHAE